MIETPPWRRGGAAVCVDDQPPPPRRRLSPRGGSIFAPPLFLTCCFCFGKGKGKLDRSGPTDRPVRFSFFSFLLSNQHFYIHTCIFSAFSFSPIHYSLFSTFYYYFSTLFHTHKKIHIFYFKIF